MSQYLFQKNKYWCALMIQKWWLHTYLDWRLFLKKCVYYLLLQTLGFRGCRKKFSVKYSALHSDNSFVCKIKTGNVFILFVCVCLVFFLKSNWKKNNKIKKNLNLCKEPLSRWWMIRQALCCITTKLDFKLVLLCEFSESSLAGKSGSKLQLKTIINGNKCDYCWL